MTTFHFTIDGGPEETITVDSGVYLNAVAAIPALFNLHVEDELIVRIWVPELLPDYGPYSYAIQYNGGLTISPAVKFYQNRPKPIQT